MRVPPIGTAIKKEMKEIRATLEVDTEGSVSAPNPIEHENELLSQDAHRKLNRLRRMFYTRKKK